MTNDVPSHDAILHADFLYMTSGGMRIDRESYLKRWANLFDPEVVPYWDTRDELITVYWPGGAGARHQQAHGAP